MANPWQHHRFGRSIYRKKESGSSWWQIPYSLRKTTLGKAGGSAREYNLSRQMSSVSSSGTFVNREETAKKHIIPLACLYFLAKSAKLKESLTVYWLVVIR